MTSSVRSRKINICIPFNNLNVLNQASLSRTPEWIAHRMNLFMNYTLKSLQKQTHQDFHAYVLYHPTTASHIQSTLNTYPPLPANVHFIPSSDYMKYIAQDIQSAHFFYEVSLHSDDLYHENFINYLYHYEPQPDTEVLICQNGYLYYSPTHRLLPYFNFSSSFNCFIYTAADYLSGKRYALKGYMDAINFKYELLPFPWYINHAHGQNAAFSLEIELARKHDAQIWKSHPNSRALIGNEIVDPSSIDDILSHYM